MALEFEFPDTGEGVTEGTFLEWLVEEGEGVEEDQAVAEVETDKAVVDVPAPASGTIKELKAEPGDTVKVGQVILVMDTGESGGAQDTTDESGEEIEAATETETSETGEKAEEPDKEGKDGSKQVGTTTSGDVLALPRVRHLAEEKGIDLASIKTGERITEEEVLEAADGAKKEGEGEKETQSGEKTVEHASSGETIGSKKVAETPGDVLATPAVRKLARQKGLDISTVKGSGRDGKITRQDVLDAAEGGKEGAKTAEETGPETESESGTEPVSSEGKTVSTEEGEVERVPMSGIQKTVAERMSESKFTAPHVTHVEKAEVTKLVELRNEKKEEVEVHLTYLPFIMKAAMLALEDFPELNAELDEKEEEFVLKKYYDFNIAVDTEHGLMTPLIEEVDEKSIIELAGQIVEKAEKAKQRELSPRELRTGTFSITNIGAIGGEAFTPILNYPQTAILGVGKISETAEVVDGEVEPRHTVKLSLSYDHRVVDGATAARFMNRLVENLEDPEHMLMEL